MTAPDTDHAAKLWELIHTGGIEFDGEMEAHLDALQRERDEALSQLEAERYLHREEIAGLQKQIDYAAKYGERDHSMGQPQPRRPTIHEQLAAERARVGRIKDLLFAVNDLATAVVDLLTDEQVEGPDYPNDLDERHAELAAICREYGDLPSDEGEAQS